MSQTSNLKEKINGVKQELESINNKLLLQQETQDLDLKDILEIEKMFLDGEIIIDFIPILEALIKQKYNSNMNKILNRLKLKKADFLLEKLRTEGYKLSQNKDFKEAVNKSIYRLLNFIRLGKRDDVT